MTLSGNGLYEALFVLLSHSLEILLSLGVLFCFVYVTLNSFSLVKQTYYSLFLF
jgi:hypothetical protein